MDQLPLLVIREIVSFLSLPERLKCKLVSKQWKLAIEMEGPQSLCIYRGTFPYRMNWCFTERDLICEEEIVYANPEKFYNFNLRIDLFKDLQKLCLFRVKMSQFIQDLYLLKKLKVLMMEGYFVDNDHIDNYRHVKLNSGSLEKLSFKYKDIDRKDMKSIEFDTPRLSSLIFWTDYAYWSPDLSVDFPINFRYPLMIKHLECPEFDTKLNVLKNLETLICQKITCPFELKDFKSLQRLELLPMEKSELDYIRGLMYEREALKRSSLEIVVCGFKELLIPFKPNNRFSLTLFDLNEHYLKQVAKHKDDFVGHIPWIIYLRDFKGFYKISKELPRNFFKKIAHIEKIEISGNVRKKKRMPFKACDVLQLLSQINPKDVEINANFGQTKEFYRELTSLKSITNLSINEKFKNLDYDAFLKLKYLQDFSIFTEKLPIDFISKIFKMIFFCNFTFYHPNFYMGFDDRYPRYQRYHFYTKYIKPNKKNKVFWSEIDKYFDCLEDLIEETKNIKMRKEGYFRDSLI